MLKADRVELALLNLIVDWGAGSPGPNWRLTQYVSSVRASVEDASDKDIVASVMVLYEDEFVNIGRYSGSTLIPYDPREGASYFYGRDFQCTPRPRARRRQQELAGSSRHGIFLSHISDERPLALRLKTFLEKSLVPAVPIFVSSDYESIQSGEDWYQAILAGIRRSEVVVSILSPESIERRWINFEAGIGIGQYSRVIPVVWRGLQKGVIGLPLGQLQARELAYERGMNALLATIGTICHCEANEEFTADFIKDLSVIDAATPSTGLEAIAYRQQGRIVTLVIRNTGTRPLEMIDAELLVSEELSQGAAFHAFSPVRETRQLESDGIKWRGFRLTTIPSHQLHLGIGPLPQVLVREAGEIVLQGINISLPQQIVENSALNQVRYRVSSKQGSVGPVIKLLSDLPER